MQLNHLSILNYKNIAQADLTFSPGINCFLGSNGEGKTNVIDSIYFLSFTKSATNSVDSLNIRHGEEMMMLKGEYEIEGVRELISCGLKSVAGFRYMRSRCSDGVTSTPCFST